MKVTVDTLNLSSESIKELYDTIEIYFLNKYKIDNLKTETAESLFNDYFYLGNCPQWCYEQLLNVYFIFYVYHIFLTGKNNPEAILSHENVVKYKII